MPDTLHTWRREQLVAEVRTQRERIVRLEAALAAAKREHLILEEDCWYSCPKSGQSCNDDADPDNCTCDADRHNAAIDRALKGEGP